MHSTACCNFGPCACRLQLHRTVKRSESWQKKTKIGTNDKKYHHLLVLLQQLTSEDHLIVWFQRFFIFLISLSSIVCTFSCSSPIDFNVHSRRLLRRAARRNHFSNCAPTAWTLNWLYHWRYMPWQISTVYSPWNLIPFPRRTYNMKNSTHSKKFLKRKNSWTS